jgi:hypothetical protein
LNFLIFKPKKHPKILENFKSFSFYIITPLIYPLHVTIDLAKFSANENLILVLNWNRFFCIMQSAIRVNGGNVRLFAVIVI